jgi:hypothetical protein
MNSFYLNKENSESMKDLEEPIAAVGPVTTVPPPVSPAPTNASPDLMQHGSAASGNVWHLPGNYKRAVKEAEKASKNMAVTEAWRTQKEREDYDKAVAASLVTAAVNASSHDENTDLMRGATTKVKRESAPTRGPVKKTIKAKTGKGEKRGRHALRGDLPLSSPPGLGGPGHIADLNFEATRAKRFAQDIRNDLYIPTYGLLDELEHPQADYGWSEDDDET